MVANYPQALFLKRRKYPGLKALEQFPNGFTNPEKLSQEHLAALLAWACGPRPIPALKELEECFDARASNPESLNSYFTRTKNSQSGG